MTSADWSTKGRISSPAPNLSPTSFIAGLDAGDVLLEGANAFARLDRARLPLVVSGGQREGQAVEDQGLGIEAVLIAAQLGQALSDLEFALGRLGHPHLVDGQGDER